MVWRRLTDRCWLTGGGAGNFGSLPTSKSKILRFGFKRWRLRLF
jgi:hypothetical protein